MSAQSAAVPSTMLRALVALSCVFGGSALQLGLPLRQQRQQLGRRGAFQLAAAASASTLLPQLAVAAEKVDPKAASTLKDTSKALKAILEQKEAFVKGLTEADPTAPSLPQSISFTTFQKLEKAAGPDFMEAAIDYAEASRNARDLVKLAKLTQEPVLITTKEKGKPKVMETKTYGEVRSPRACAPRQPPRFAQPPRTASLHGSRRIAPPANRCRPAIRSLRPRPMPIVQFRRCWEPALPWRPRWRSYPEVVPHPPLPPRGLQCSCAFCERRESAHSGRRESVEC